MDLYWSPSRLRWRDVKVQKCSKLVKMQNDIFRFFLLHCNSFIDKIIAICDTKQWNYTNQEMSEEMLIIRMQKGYENLSFHTGLGILSNVKTAFMVSKILLQVTSKSTTRGFSDIFHHSCITENKWSFKRKYIYIYFSS